MFSGLTKLECNILTLAQNTTFGRNPTLLITENSISRVKRGGGGFIHSVTLDLFGKSSLFFPLGRSKAYPRNGECDEVT